MPLRPPKTCRSPGCPGTTVDSASGLCLHHDKERQERRAKRDVEARKTWQAKLDQQRGSAHQRGYTSRWRRFREDFLSRNPLCAECARHGRVSAATVVDHVTPHRGNKALFWQPGNHQPLCVACHTAKTLEETKTAAPWAKSPEVIDSIDLI